MRSLHGRIAPVALVLAAAAALAGCNAFGNLTTGAMTTTNAAVGASPAGPSHP